MEPETIIQDPPKPSEQEHAMPEASDWEKENLRTITDGMDDGYYFPRIFETVKRIGELMHVSGVIRLINV